MSEQKRLPGLSASKTCDTIIDRLDNTTFSENFYYLSEATGTLYRICKEIEKRNKDK